MSTDQGSFVTAQSVSSRLAWDDRFVDPLIFVRGGGTVVSLDLGPGTAYLAPETARVLADKLNQAADDTEGREAPAAEHTIESAKVCTISNSEWVPDGMLAVTVLVPATYAPHIGLGTDTTLTIHPQEGN